MKTTKMNLRNQATTFRNQQSNPETAAPAPRPARRGHLPDTTVLVAVAVAALMNMAPHSRAAMLYFPDPGTNSVSDMNLEDTVSAARDGDTIVIAPGQYTLTNQVVITNAITLKGSMGAAQTFFNVNMGDYGFWVSNSAAVLDGLTIQAPDNSYAADIFLVGGTVQNCNFTNIFTLRDGTVLFMVGGMLTNGNISYGNIPFNDYHVAVYCTAGGLITDSRVLPHYEGLAGAVYLDGSQLRNSTLSGLPPIDESQGGLAIDAHSSAITGCFVVGGGSGAHLDSCLMDRCVVTGCVRGTCSTNDGGGGIFEANSIIRDSLILSNRVFGQAPDCPAGPGGGVYMQGGALINCTVAENSAPAGAGVYVQNGGTVTNCIIFDNSSSGANQWLSDGSGIFDHCCTSPDPGGAGNVIQDPRFNDPAKGDYHLASASPCIGAGVVQPWMANATDLDGNPRTSNGGVDMGAYQTLSTNSPPPSLSIFATSTNTVVIAWPASAAGYVLEQKSNLVSSAWVGQNATPNAVNRENQVTVFPSAGGMLYRLRHN